MYCIEPPLASHELSLPSGQYSFSVDGTFPIALQTDLDFVGHNIFKLTQLVAPLQFTVRLFAVSAYIFEFLNPLFGFIVTTQSTLSGLKMVVVVILRIKD